jgi:hypothetical protein
LPSRKMVQDVAQGVVRDQPVGSREGQSQAPGGKVTRGSGGFLLSPGKCENWRQVQKEDKH